LTWCFRQEECIVVRDDINNHHIKDRGRDPRYVDLIAAIMLVALVGTVLVLLNRGFAIEPVQTAGVDHYVRW
jgi:hypothetical protein